MRGVAARLRYCLTRKAGLPARPCWRCSGCVHTMPATLWNKYYDEDHGAQLRDSAEETKMDRRGERQQLFIIIEKYSYDKKTLF